LVSTRRVALAIRTGKTLLVNLIALIATGEIAPLISQGKDEEELEKRLGGELIEGALLVAIDNCLRPLSGAFLDKVVTEQALKVRVLGTTGNVLTLVNCMLLATGNNLTVAADLTRRTVICAMDSGWERPELRKFNVDIFKTVRAERGRLVAAALTILRAWHVTKPEDVAVPDLGSFEEWAYRICGPLIWLGCEDPCKTVEKVRENDPEREALVAVIAQWREHAVATGQTVQEIVELSFNNTGLRKALCAIAAGRDGFPDNRRLGVWLGKVKDRIVAIPSSDEESIEKWKILRGKLSMGERKWELIECTEKI
jgi:putative DNA primase/helicase